MDMGMTPAFRDGSMNEQSKRQRGKVLGVNR